MGLDWKGAINGGIKGGTEGAQTGNGYVAAGDAILRAILGAFGKGDSVPSFGGTGDFLGGGKEDAPAPDGGGVNPGQILSAIQSFSGGFGKPPAGAGQEDPTRDKVVQTTPSVPAQPATLLGFPSMQAMAIRNQLQTALSRSRGF